MGYDLYNEKGEHFHLGISTWPQVLDLAQMHGWTPEGTQAPAFHDVRVVTDESGNYVLSTLDELSQATHKRHEAEAWDGWYLSNNAQKVTATDAAALAEALTRALPLIPSVETGLSNNAGRKTPMDYFSGPENKAYISEFVDFCHGGSFSIH